MAFPSFRLVARYSLLIIVPLLFLLALGGCPTPPPPYLAAFTGGLAIQAAGDSFTMGDGSSGPSGSAAWMYRAWAEAVLGLKIHGDQMRLDPVIPGWWQGYQLRYRYGEAIYEIQVENPQGRQHGVSWVEMDGRRLPDKVIPLERAVVRHRILAHMGDGA